MGTPRSAGHTCNYINTGLRSHAVALRASHCIHLQQKDVPKRCREFQPLKMSAAFEGEQEDDHDGTVDMLDGADVQILDDLEGQGNGGNAHKPS